MEPSTITKTESVVGTLVNYIWGESNTIRYREFSNDYENNGYILYWNIEKSWFAVFFMSETKEQQTYEKKVKQLFNSKFQCCCVIQKTMLILFSFGCET